MHMKKKISWTGTHRGITYEIQNFDFGDGKLDKWTFYLYIRLDQMPKEVRERFWLKANRRKFSKMGQTHTTYDYCGESLIDGIRFHCGCTWYSKEHGFDGSDRVVKVGCDYAHLYDDHQTYSESYIESEAKDAIDSLHEMVPNIMRSCRYCGRFMKSKEENPIHKKCLEASNAWTKEHCTVKEP